ncbi:hypothetical protein ACBI99_19130 [Nonomuraea sp. ATR24]|uniref:hypothetical protein n=1 Tax=Nonomuraea sp. ATR24 TaxID=1676744 RepID=UPI0035C172C2
MLQGLVPGGSVEAAAAQMVMMALAALTGSDGAADADTEACREAEEPDQRAGLGVAVEVLVKAVRMQAAGMGSVRQVVERAGGATAQLADIEEVTAYQHDNHELLIQQFFKADRPTMLALSGSRRRRGSRWAVPLSQYTHSMAPPLERTGARRCSRSRSTTFNATISAARAAVSYSIRHSVFSRSGMSRRDSSRWMVVLATARVSSVLSLRRSASGGTDGAAQRFWYGTR